MKRFIVILALVTVMGGCADINQFLCSPTPSQTESANVGKAVASAILAGATYYSGNAVITLVNTYAIPVYDRVIAGYCVAQSEWDAAVAAIQEANNQAIAQGGTVKGFKLLGPYDRQIADLRKVKW